MIKPIEQTRILGAGHYTGKRLIEVMMGVDQSGEDDVAAEVDHLVGLRRQLGRRCHLLDPTVTGEQTPVLDLLAVHGHEHIGMTDEQGSHRHQS